MGSLETHLPQAASAALSAPVPSANLAVGYLGAAKQFKRAPETKTEVHAAIVRGLPYSALIFLVGSLTELAPDEVIEAAGISPRTLRRQKDAPNKAMPADLGSRTWMLAETLAKASTVFGSRAAAERWMSKPAMGLDGHRPIALLHTVQGAELVNEFLDRLEHGVYN